MTDWLTGDQGESNFYGRGLQPVEKEKPKMAVYRADVWICATAYVQAESAEEAASKLLEFDMSSLELQEQDLDANGLEISGAKFSDPDLPEVSLSPAMTVYVRNIQHEVPKLDENDMEEAE